jgi:tRNA synthetases class I (W and Y)
VTLSLSTVCRQGADFVHLYQRHGVRVQTGGSDQWGNITAGDSASSGLSVKYEWSNGRMVPSPKLCWSAGTELLRKVEGGEEKEVCFGLTFPLLTKADGRKFGKSEDGAIWLSAGGQQRSHWLCCALVHSKQTDNTSGIGCKGKASCLEQHHRDMIHCNLLLHMR